MIDERYEDGDYMFADCPDNWVVLEILGSDDTGAATFTYKVLAGWSGGYLHGDNWKLNSGIVKVRELADAWVFIGNSGSEYICDKEQYKLRMNNADIYEKMITIYFIIARSINCLSQQRLCLMGYSKNKAKKHVIAPDTCLA